MKKLAILLIGGAALVGCKKRVKSEEIEAWVKKRTDELGMNASKVTCPKDIEPKVGGTFECKVEVEGKSYPLVATVTSIEGSQMKFDTAWKDGGSGVVFRNKLEPALTTELSKELATPVTIACAEPLLFRDAKGNVTCDLTGGATKAKVIVSLDDKLVPTGWKLDPPLLAKAKLEGLLTPSVREKTSPTTTVACGSEPLLARPATGIVVCEIADGDKKAKINVEVDAELTIQKWEAVP